MLYDSGEGSRNNHVALPRVCHRIVIWLSVLIIFIQKTEEMKWDYIYMVKKQQLYSEGWCEVDTRLLVWFGQCCSVCLCSVIAPEGVCFCLAPSCWQNDLACFWHSVKLFMNRGHYHLAFQARTAQLTVIRDCFLYLSYILAIWEFEKYK